MSDTVLDVILGRRSIRLYTAEPVTRDEITELLRAAMAAPSAGNEQPWHFVVITDRSLLEAIPALSPYAGMAKRAPAAILACGDPSLEKYPGYWVQDLSAAVENLLLAAHARGLGAVWCGIYPLEERVEAFRRLLDIPSDIIPFALVSLGRPAEEKPPAERYQPGRVHENGW